MTPEQFLSKNLKWITIGFMCLFLFKCTESCNRGTKITRIEKKYEYVIDSLNTSYRNYQETSEDSIDKLNFELKLSVDHAKSANERANAIQNTVDRVKSNTTVVVKREEEKNK